LSEVKIGVGAGVGNVEQAIAKITAQMNKLGAAVAANQKLKFEPTDVKLMARDLELINKQFKQVIALSPQLRNALKVSGQSGAQLSQINFSNLSTDPRIAQRMRDRAFMHSVRGTSLDPTLSNDVDAEGNVVRPGPAPRPAPVPRPPHPTREAPEKPRGSMFRRIAGGFSGGVGGPLGSIAGEGIEGTAAGGVGLLGGLGIGAAVTAAVMAGKAISEGVGMAKDRNLGLDTLKRSMGDLGVSFESLSDASWRAGKGLGIANTEFVKLEQQAFSQSGGAYRDPAALAAATRSGADLSRAYGLDPSQGVAFVSGMGRLNSRQNNKELAAQIAEAIRTSSGKATPSEVMQAMQGFASAQNRFNSGSTDLNRFGNAYSSLLGNDGMTADHASSILGAANSAMQQMGGSEAGQNYTLRAFGGLDPIRARIRAEGGLFGNGLDNGAIAAYMGKGWNAGGTGPAGSNFSLINKQFDRDYAGRGQFGREMELDAQKNYWHLNSYADTASFVRMSDPGHNKVMGLLKDAGVGLGDLREGGVQTLSSIAGATDMKSLSSLYDNTISKRPDLSGADKDLLSKLEKGGDAAAFKNGLVRVLAGKGQEDDVATNSRDIAADIDDIKTNIGGKLIPMTNTMMLAMVALAKKLAGYDDTVGPPRSAMNPSFNSNGADPSNASLPGVGTMSRPGGAGNGGLSNGQMASASALKAQLIAAGMDEAHADAILGNSMRESSLSPTAQNGDHYGLFQWDKTRQAGFSKWAGHSIVGSSAQEQMAYLLQEMGPGGGEYGNSKRFRDATGIGSASSYLSMDVIRPGHDSIENPIRGQLSEEMAKIPANARTGGGVANGVGAGSGSGAMFGPTGDIIINLEQHNTNGSGQTKSKKLSTSVPIPSGSGATNKISLPGSN